MSASQPFWKIKSLNEMTQDEWESLCDGCGKCCMAKLIDEDTDEIHFTTVACRLFDAASCRCKDYQNRQAKVSDCVALTPQNVGEIAWLPNSCAYRMVAEGRDLEPWHPLISGDNKTVHLADISMRGRVTAFEQEISDDSEYLDHLVDGEP